MAGGVPCLIAFAVWSGGVSERLIHPSSPRFDIGDEETFSISCESNEKCLAVVLRLGPTAGDGNVGALILDGSAGQSETDGLPLEID